MYNTFLSFNGTNHKPDKLTEFSDMRYLLLNCGCVLRTLRVTFSGLCKLLPHMETGNSDLLYNKRPIVIRKS